MHIVEEWNETLAEKLVAGAHEPHILRWTPRDATERFTDLATTLAWYEQMERHVFPLWDGNQLQGITWFSKHPEPVAGADYTFAIRMYEPGVGKGLAEPFVNAAMETMEQYEMKSVWLDTDATNERAIHLYKKLGFVEIDAKNGRVLMIRK